MDACILGSPIVAADLINSGVIAYIGDGAPGSLFGVRCI